MIHFCIHLINYHQLLLLITLWTPLPVEVVEDADAPPEVVAAADDDGNVDNIYNKTFVVVKPDEVN